MSALPPRPAVLALMLIMAFMFAGNHVAARIAFNHGLDVATAVTVRSLGTAAAVALMLWLQGVRWQLSAQHKRVMPLIGLLVGVQSLFLYASVARLPVALALLAFNTFPLWTSLWARLLHQHPVQRRLLIAMPVILIGLTLALDVAGAASGLDFAAHWASIGSGVAFGVAAAATFGLILVVTQHQVADLDGRVRSAITMLTAGAVALLAMLSQGGAHWPTASAGWWGLAALTFLYGTAFTVMFTLLPRIGVVANSPLMNVEPVAALILAWLLLGQTVAPVQIAGALLVVGAVMALGLRRQ